MKTFMLATSSPALLLASMNAAFAGATTTPVPVPEPSTLAVLAIGVAGAVVAARMRNKK